eukprot:COSAG05_NODE_2006_length_3716_cov_1.634504_1_plen_218_part_00
MSWWRRQGRGCYPCPDPSINAESGPRGVCIFPATPPFLSSSLSLLRACLPGEHQLHLLDISDPLLLWSTACYTLSCVTALDTDEDDESKSAEPGQYVTLILVGVTQDAAQSLQRRVIRTDGRAPDPLIACGLLQHENQLSVVHMLVQKCPEYEDPVKSKTPLVVHLGFRRFTSRPIYSDHNINSDKSKLQRYMVGGFTVATGTHPWAVLCMACRSCP